MGAIDDFLVATVTPHLLAGEAIQICAHAREPKNFTVLGVPTRNEHWLLVATNYRLFMFETSAGGMMEHKPRAEARNGKIFGFDEMASVAFKTTHYGQLVPGGPPMMFAITPHPHCGPDRGGIVRFDIYGSSEGLDQQSRFKQFPEWLAGQIAAGAYPMDEQKRQHILAEANARYEALAKKAKEDAAKQAAFLRKLAPAAAVLVWLAVLGGFGLLTFAGGWDAKRFSEWRASDAEKLDKLKEEQKKLKAGELPVDGCSPKAESCGSCDHGEAYTKYWTKPGHTPKSDGWTVVKDEGVKWFCPPAKNLDSSIKMAGDDVEQRTTDTLIGVAKLVGGFFLTIGWIVLGVFLKKRFGKKAEPAAAPAAV